MARANRAPLPYWMRTVRQTATHVMDKQVTKLGRLIVKSLALCDVTIKPSVGSRYLGHPAIVSHGRVYETKAMNSIYEKGVQLPTPLEK